MYSKYLLFTLLFISISASTFAQKITISANHTDAKFFLVNDRDEAQLTEIGTGTVEIKLEKDSRNRVLVTKTGYEPVLKEYSKSVKWDKNQTVTLENRLVEITAEPYDAEIFVDGRMVGTKQINLIVGKDRFLNVEIKKPGFAPITKTYYNSPDRETPPAKDYFELKDRSVRLDVIPADGNVVANGVSLGKGNQDVAVPLGECVTVSVNKDGFVEYTQVFCNKPDIDPEPPIRAQAKLEDRLVKITTNPTDAIVTLAGKTVGTGSYELMVPKNGSAEVTLFKEGYVPYTITYFNQSNKQEPPVSDNIELAVDEAYNSSVSSDLANVRITVPVNPEYSAEEAWKILSSIITRYFDILETVDFNTGYLTTSWQVENFNAYITRTRVIVSSGGNSDQLAYAVKLISQEARQSNENPVTVKDDEKFEDWERILKKYEGLIQEIQARIQ